MTQFLGILGQLYIDPYHERVRRRGNQIEKRGKIQNRATLCDSRLNNEARLQIKNNFVIKLEVEGTVIDWKSEKPIF